MYRAIIIIYWNAKPSDLTAQCQTSESQQFMVYAAFLLSLTSALQLVLVEEGFPCHTAKRTLASNKRNSTLFPTGILPFFHKNGSPCTIFKQKFTYQIQYSTKKINNEQLNPTAAMFVSLLYCFYCKFAVILLLTLNCIK